MINDHTLVMENESVIYVYFNPTIWLSHHFAHYQCGDKIAHIRQAAVDAFKDSYSANLELPIFA